MQTYKHKNLQYVNMNFPQGPAAGTVYCKHLESLREQGDFEAIPRLNQVGHLLFTNIRPAGLALNQDASLKMF